MQMQLQFWPADYCPLHRRTTTWLRTLRSSFRGSVAVHRWSNILCMTRDRRATDQRTQVQSCLNRLNSNILVLTALINKDNIINSYNNKAFLYQILTVDALLRANCYWMHEPSTYAYVAKAIDVIAINYLFTISISAFVSFYYVPKHSRHHVNITFGGTPYGSRIFR